MHFNETRHPFGIEDAERTPRTQYCRVATKKKHMICCWTIEVDLAQCLGTRDESILWNGHLFVSGQIEFDKTG